MTDALQPNPMEIMRGAAPEGARTYLEHRAAIMDNPELQAVPLKYKLLVGIGVAAALQSSTCTVQWAKQAMQSGATKEEIVEADPRLAPDEGGDRQRHGGGSTSLVGRTGQIEIAPRASASMTALSARRCRSGWRPRRLACRVLLLDVRDRHVGREQRSSR